ncbi:MAG: bifunctional DNA-formamidopyrimidine glycosylase/DNA-(apurinic or apyrimidinic site) lyase [Gemmatimonadaceae bacterium]
MPELPEVEFAAATLDSAVRGKTIARVTLHHPSLAKRVTRSALRRLEGLRIVAVERRGKHQLIGLSDGSAIHVHFRMTGDWSVGRGGDAVPRFMRARFDLADGTRIALVDPRALATVALLADGEDALPPLGPDALGRAFTAAALAIALGRRHGPIKPALLDQRIVAGLGNIYAAEALWEAKISPTASASGLAPARRGALVRAIRLVLRRAKRRSGRYANGDAEGRFKVYDREGEPCRRCGEAIARIVQAGRSTYYCPACQV